MEASGRERERERLFAAVLSSLKNQLGFFFLSFIIPPLGQCWGSQVEQIHSGFLPTLFKGTRALISVESIDASRCRRAPPRNLEALGRHCVQCVQAWLKHHLVKTSPFFGERLVASKHVAQSSGGIGPSGSWGPRAAGHCRMECLTDPSAKAAAQHVH